MFVMHAIPIIVSKPACHILSDCLLDSMGSGFLIWRSPVRAQDFYFFLFFIFLWIIRYKSNFSFFDIKSHIFGTVFPLEKSNDSVQRSIFQSTSVVLYDILQSSVHRFYSFINRVHRDKYHH